MTTTRVQADIASWQAQPDLVLNPGSIAPFKGVLVNPDHYKLFTIDHAENENFKLNMDHIIKGDPPPIINEGSLKSFFIGIALGIVGGVAITNTIHH